MVRGSSYSPEEDTALARCWVSISGQYDEQDATTFWQNVADAFRGQPEAIDHERTPASLQARWQTLQMLVQKFLAAERVYYAQAEPSGTTAADARKSIMALYCKRSRKVDRNGVEKDAPPLKSLGAVAVLRNIPKFGATGGSSRTCAEYTPGSGSEGQFVNTSMESQGFSSGAIKKGKPSESRPVGIKKSLRKVATAANATGLSDIAAALKDSSRRKEAMKKAQLRFSVINALPDGDTKTKLLLELLNSNTIEGESKNNSTPSNDDRVSISNLLGEE